MCDVGYIHCTDRGLIMMDYSRPVFDQEKAEKLLGWLKRRHSDPLRAMETMAIAIAALLCAEGNSEGDTLEEVDHFRGLLQDIVSDMWAGKASRQ